MTTVTLPTDFWDTNDSPGYLKAGLLGFAGTGKTMTGTLLAVAAREVLKLEGPVAFFDTETGSAYIKNHVRNLTGKDLLVKKSRSLADLLKFLEQCQRTGVSVAIVDSLTHVWREVCDGYLVQKNEQRRLANPPRPAQKRLEFEDWNVIKPRWAVWTDAFLNSPLSIVICGRAGWEYEMSKDEETGKKTLDKVGIKMKVEGEFGFEPSLILQLETIQTLAPGATTPEITRRATCLKDRFTVLDGRNCEFDSSDMNQAANLAKAYAAVKKFAGGHLALLTPGSHTQIETDQPTDFGMGGEDGDALVVRERREREVLCEEIQGEITLVLPGQSAQEKKAKVEVLKEAFGTSSWTSIEAMRADKLRAGKAKLAEVLNRYRVPDGPAKAAAPAAVDVPAPVAAVAEVTPVTPVVPPANGLKPRRQLDI